VGQHTHGANQRTCTVTSSEGNLPSVSRALNQDVTSGGDLPGRRDRRGSGQNRDGIIDWPRIVQKRRRLENESRRCEGELEFLQVEIRIGLLFRALALGNIFAEFARVLAIERFHQRFTERGILGIADDHLCPRQCLKKCPMQADGRSEEFGQP